MATAVEPPADDIRRRTDRMYRPQKRINDLTRRCCLLGRDRLIAELDARPGQTVLDVGCGTGRNLALIGQRYPAARLFGLDAAEPMLEVAAARLRRACVRAELARGVAEELDPEALFGHRGGFDHVTISYCLSMVDDPECAVQAAFRCLALAGTLHVVDFGDMAGLPRWFRRGIAAWLRRFGVRHRPAVEATLRALAGAGSKVETTEIGRRYALPHKLRCC